MYDDHYNQVCEQKIIPYLSMNEYLEQIYEYTENHGLNYAEFRISVTMPKKKLCRSFSALPENSSMIKDFSA